MLEDSSTKSSPTSIISSYLGSEKNLNFPSTLHGYKRPPDWDTEFFETKKKIRCQNSSVQTEIFLEQPEGNLTPFKSPIRKQNKGSCRKNLFEKEWKTCEETETKASENADEVGQMTKIVRKILKVVERKKIGIWKGQDIEVKARGKKRGSDEINDLDKKSQDKQNNMVGFRVEIEERLENKCLDMEKCKKNVEKYEVSMLEEKKVEENCLEPRMDQQILMESSIEDKQIFGKTIRNQCPYENILENPFKIQNNIENVPDQIFESSATMSFNSTPQSMNPFFTINTPSFSVKSEDSDIISRIFIPNSGISLLGNQSLPVLPAQIEEKNQIISQTSYSNNGNCIFSGNPIENPGQPLSQINQTNPFLNLGAIKQVEIPYTFGSTTQIPNPFSNLPVSKTLIQHISSSNPQENLFSTINIYLSQPFTTQTTESSCIFSEPTEKVQNESSLKVPQIEKTLFGSLDVEMGNFEKSSNQVKSDTFSCL